MSKPLNDISVDLNYNALRISFSGVTHVRIDVTKYLAHQSWREGYGNKKWVIEFTMEGGATLTCEYDRENKWLAVLAGLDRVLDAPT